MSRPHSVLVFRRGGTSQLGNYLQTTRRIPKRLGERNQHERLSLSWGESALTIRVLSLERNLLAHVRLTRCCVSSSSLRVDGLTTMAAQPLS
jgi:hypothetical protein